MAKLVLFDYRGTTDSLDSAEVIYACKAKGNCVAIRTASSARELREDGIIDFTRIDGVIEKAAVNDNYSGYLNLLRRRGFDSVDEVVFVDDEPWYAKAAADMLGFRNMPARVLTPEEARKEFT